MIAIFGGAGYIGSHIAREFDKSKLEYTVFDNKLATNGNLFAGNQVHCDIRDLSDLQKAFEGRNVELVIHLAGLKDARESDLEKEAYRQNNIEGTKNLLSVMTSAGCRKIIYSSTAAVYKGTADTKLPFTELSEISPPNFYGLSKFLAEEEIRKFSEESGISALVFRFFNVVGANFPSSIESIEGSITSNLIHAIRGSREFRVFGDNYETFDGTAVRDYVHVDDVVKAHLNAVNSLDGLMASFNILNLGSSKGYSVLQLIDEMSKVSGQSIRYVIDEGNKFDLPFAVADNTAAKKQLGWYPLKSINDICTDSLKYFH